MPTESLVDPRRAMSISSIPGLLEHHAKRNPDALAILAPGRAPLTYGRLNQHLDQVGRTLRARGIGRRDRVAVVLPNGPEMAVAFLTIAAHAVCVPINPAYGVEGAISSAHPILSNATSMPSVRAAAWTPSISKSAPDVGMDFRS